MQLRALLSLCAIAAACAGLLAVTNAATRDAIAANRAATEMRALRALIGPVAVTDGGWQGNAWPLCEPLVLVRVAAAGYGGSIRLLVAVAHTDDNRVHGLRVIEHQETPGIADFLQRPNTGWLAGLTGRGLGQLDAVDAVAGATITSRAVQRGLREALGHAARPADCPVATTETFGT